MDRSHSVSKEDRGSHKRESLIDRKRTNFFKSCLPCRPMAECFYPSSCPTVPGIHVFAHDFMEDVDGRDKPAMTERVFEKSRFEEIGGGFL